MDREALAAYDEWHREHATGSGPWYEMVRSRLDGSELLNNARALEIGCGGGHFTRWMAAQGAREVIGADFSPTVINRANSEAAPANLHFEIQDIERLPYEDDSFELVVSCETIEHVPRPQRAVRELARVLQPGGTLLLTCPNYMSVMGLHRLYREATGRKWTEGGQPICHWTMYPKTATWLRRAGLGIAATAGTGFYLPIPRRTEPFEPRMPSGVRRAFRLLGAHVMVEAQKP
jgi:2-polyprenyl-3-methyl-5-hydroxy-6-metoxy-1,4-benzoquinol methylase